MLPLSPPSIALAVKFVAMPAAKPPSPTAEAPVLNPALVAVKVPWMIAANVSAPLLVPQAKYFVVVAAASVKCLIPVLKFPLNAMVLMDTLALLMPVANALVFIVFIQTLFALEFAGPVAKAHLVFI